MPPDLILPAILCGAVALTALVFLAACIWLLRRAIRIADSRNDRMDRLAHGDHPFIPSDMRF